MDELKAKGADGINSFADLRMGASSRLATGGADASSSSFATEMGEALNSLSGLDNSGKLREDAIQNAKAVIKNWVPPTDSQISAIIQKMRGELLA